MLPEISVRKWCVIFVMVMMACPSSSSDVEQRGFEQLTNWLQRRGASAGLSSFEMAHPARVRGLKLANSVGDGDRPNHSLELELTADAVLS